MPLYLLAASSALLSSQALRGPFFSFFAVMGMAYGIFGLKSKPKAQTLFCACYSLGATYWLSICLHHALGLNAFLSCGLMLLLVPLFTLLWRLEFHLANKLSVTTDLPLFATSLFLLETLRLQTPFALPWTHLGYLALYLPGGAHLFALGGLLLASYVLYKALELLSTFPFLNHNNRLWQTSHFIALCALLYFFHLTTSNSSSPNPDMLAIHLHQRNLSPKIKRSDPSLATHTYLASLQQYAPHSPEKALHLLPEGVISLDHIHYQKASGHHSQVPASIIGSVYYHQSDQPYQAALGFGGVQGSSMKTHLVPFGESIPFLSSLPSSISTLIPLPFQSFQASSGPSLLHYHASNILPFICYDLFFPAPKLAREAHLLVALAENTWYGNSYLQPLLIAMAKARVLETGKPLALVSNRGPSLLLNEHASSLKQTRFDTVQVPHFTSRLFSHQTFYTSKNAYRLWIWILAFELATLALIQLSKKRHSRNKSSFASSSPTHQALPQ